MIIDNSIKKDRYLGSEVLFHGIICKVSSVIDDQHYRLIPVEIDYEKLRNDKSFTEDHMWGAMAVPIFCSFCGKITWFDDSNILEGLKYEVNCEYCDMIMFRKKV